MSKNVAYFTTTQDAMPPILVQSHRHINTG